MFIGREKELNIIDKRIESSSFEFGIIYGRRRIGKTYLLKEVVKKHQAIYYVANELGFNHNVTRLGETIANYFEESFTFNDIESIFSFLVKQSRNRKIVLLIDEFTYLLGSESALLSILQNIIDHELINTNLKLIISGSHIGMMEDLIAYKNPLYGRSTFKLKIEAFDYYDAAKFYPKMNYIDKITMYSIFGGVPFYIARINDVMSVKDNIVSLIIESGATFEDEVKFFLSQEVRSVATYGKILNAIANGKTKLNEISNYCNETATGNTAKYLDTLMNLGIVEKEICFGEKKNSKKTIYKMKDQLFSFHYRFIENNQTRKNILQPDRFFNLIIEPELNKYISFEFKRICREFLMRKHNEEIKNIGRYWYNDSKAKTQVEIDILMECNNQLTAYECKWATTPLDARVVKELEEKAKKLNIVHFGFFVKTINPSIRDNYAHTFYLAEELYNL